MPRRTLPRTAWPYALAVLLAAAAAVAVGMLGGGNRPLAANRITITADDYVFLVPDTVQAGIATLELVNRGEELHHAMLIRLDEDRTLAELQEELEAVLRAGGEPRPWVVFAGGPNAVDPGASASVTVALRPGRYALVCLIASPDGDLHVAKGMIRELIVAPARAATDLPPADAAVVLSDYGFEFSRPLAAGRQTLRVRNDAVQWHEIQLFRLDPGKTVEDLERWLAAADGPPPGASIGGVAALSQGHANNLALNLTPGEYALVCFLPDSQDGKPHFVHGMIKGFTVE